MGVALQAGVLAGGVVFVPMALAGWHLTRNRVLFFSAALFIVLAVSVHLLPYFPTMSSLLHSIHTPWPYMSVVNSVPPITTPTVNCLLHLHDLVWEDVGWVGNDKQFSTTAPVTEPAVPREFRWSRTGIAATFCRHRKLNSHDMVDLFRGTWIVVAGDSQLRLFFLSLLELLMPGNNPGRINPLRKHSSYEYFWEEENIKFQFKWTPFTSNLTDLVLEYRRNLTYPDVLVMGGGLWHMLYSSNSTRYVQGLVRLRRAVKSLFPSPSDFQSQTHPSLEDIDSGSGTSWSGDAMEVPHVFWINVPTLINSWLNSELKRVTLTSSLCDQYDEALQNSRLVNPGSPLTLIDLRSISRGCGQGCTTDGMHYNNVTYEAAVHIMVNALLIATQQSPAA